MVYTTIVELRGELTSVSWERRSFFTCSNALLYSGLSSIKSKVSSESIIVTPHPLKLKFSVIEKGARFSNLSCEKGKATHLFEPFFETGINSS